MIGVVAERDVVRPHADLREVLLASGGGDDKQVGQSPPGQPAEATDVRVRIRRAAVSK